MGCNEWAAMGCNGSVWAVMNGPQCAAMGAVRSVAAAAPGGAEPQCGELQRLERNAALLTAEALRDDGAERRSAHGVRFVRYGALKGTAATLRGGTGRLKGTARL